MNVQEELKALKERIAELEEQVKVEQEFPQYGQWYWHITSDAGIGMSSWGEFEFEKEQLSIGNIFRTREEAKFALEKLKVEAELRKFSGPASEGSAYIYRLVDTNQIGLGVKFYSQSQGTIYFESAEKALQAIESVGEERIKRYIFEVEDYL